MKITVIGSKGMLGSNVVAACKTRGYDVVGLDLPELDITAPDSLADHVPPCDWMINCAAYTNVDDAETDRSTAYAVNAEGPGNLATLAQERNIRILHMSTDYVFDGTKDKPYHEEDATNPLNVYGASKLAGEQAVLERCEQALVARTQSLFGLRGKNFIRTIAGKLQESGEALRVVNDQFSSPTYTVHLADALLALVETGCSGVVHTSASGACSWHELACAVAARMGVDAEIRPVSSSEFSRPANRPNNAILSKERFEEWTGERIPVWEEGMLAYLKEEGLIT